jgi:hypothetical protein
MADEECGHGENQYNKKFKSFHPSPGGKEGINHILFSIIGSLRKT